MDAGLIFAADKFRFQLEAALSLTNSGANFDKQAGAAIATAYTTSPTITVLGVGLSLGGIKNDLTGVGSERRYTLEVNGVWAPADFVSTFAAALESYVDFLDLKVYAFDSYFQVEWSGIEWYVEGGLHDSDGAGSIAGADPFLTPTSIPLLGVPATLSATASYNPQEFYPPPIDGDKSVSSSIQATGGYTWLKDAVWHAPDVDLDVPGYLSACGCTEATSPILAATTTANGQVSALAAYGTSESPPLSGTGFAYSEGSGSSVCLVPNLAKSVLRNENDYRAMIYRGGMPQSSWRQVSTCQFDLASDGTSNVLETEYAPSQSEILSVVGSSPAALEDTFDYGTKCPFGAAKTRVVRTENFSGNFCDQTQNVEFAWSDESIENSNSDVLPFLRHTNAAIRYLNTWANPHWSFFYWFPPDEAGAAMPYEWEVEGARANPTDYWLPAHQQWLSHPDLSEAEDRQTRTDLISAPLTGGGLNGWINTVFGQFTSWWGISRFDVLRPDFYGEFRALDSASEPGWTETDCVATFGADISVNASAAQCILEYDLGRFTEEPYQFPHLCQKIEVGWTLTNISNVAVYLVGVDGEEVLLTNNVEGVFAWPQTGDAAKYAGSWGQDFGFGFTTNDEGVDTVVADGISAATLADAERNSAFQLLPGRTAATLKFVIDVTDDTVDVNIDYPIFRMTQGSVESDHLTGVVETALWSSLLVRDGPGVRWGQLNYWDYIGGVFQDPPEVAPFAIFAQRTVLDAYCWVNHFLKGVAADTDVDTDLAALYDSVEGQTKEAASDWTYGILWVLRDEDDAEKGASPGFLLVNTFREVPPLAHLPRGSRSWDTALVEDVDNFAQQAVSLASEPRYIVAPEPNHCHQDEDSPRSQWTTASDRILSGWKISEHTHTVDNEEEDAHIVHRGGIDLATASPFHGYFMVGELGQDSDSNVSCDVSLSWRHFRARIEAGEVWLGVAPNTLPLTYAERNTAIPAEWVCIRVVRDSKEQTLVLLVEDAGDVKFYFSTDEGATWGMATTIAAGAKPTLEIGRNGLRYYYWIDGTAIKGQIRDSANAVVVSTFTAVASGVEDAGIAVREFNRAGGGHSIELHYVSSGSVTTVTSPDGQVFS